MDRELLKSYRDRWKAVEEVEAAEARSLTFEERLRQTAALFEFARTVGKPDERDDVQEVRERWVRLKELYCESAKRQSGAA